ncbi:MAG: type II CRISPR-associated endonuclease Cas1 [Clostridium sp.]
MTWRTVIVSRKCKLTYKNNHLLIKNEEMKMVHLSEINSIVIDTTNVSITTMLLKELMDRKIKIIFCDEKHNPKGEVIPYYGHSSTSNRLLKQIRWSEQYKNLIWDYIIRNKIKNQGKVLKIYDKENSELLEQYILNVENGDKTNREGHSAKVYFNSLFGMEFTRDKEDYMNAALDYGYAILLSNFNREIVNAGYLTQLGVHHKNEYNYFNLSCDFMEPFRPVVDKLVYSNKEQIFDKEYKYKLLNILNEKVLVNGNEYYVSNAINIYINNILKVLEKEDISYMVEIDII